MAYDEELADRIRAIVAVEDGVDERRMFGGLAFLLGGHMAVAASGQGGLMLRIDSADAESLVAADGVERMVMHGREMDGWLQVEDAVGASDEQLREWVGHGVRYVRALPPKG